MAGLRALLGLFPKTGDYESKLNQLEQEFQELNAIRNSKELMEFHELEAEVKSEEFANKKKEILSLRFKQTDDFQKEKKYKKLQKDKGISLYYKTKDSSDLQNFYQIGKSDELKRYHELEAFVNSKEFAEAKREASLSARQKFARSDLAKTFQQYEAQRKSSKIISYYKFIKNKAYPDYIATLEGGINKKVEALLAETGTSEFRQKMASMSKAEKKISSENQKLEELQGILKSKAYKNYQKLNRSLLRSGYEEMHNTDELEAFEDLSNFITSDEFKRQKKEIESKGFRDTDEYVKLQEYESLKKSPNIRFYMKFKDSRELKNFQALEGSDIIRNFEELETYIKGDEFARFKAYCLKSPGKRWSESKEYEILQDYELKKKSEKIAWYFTNKDHKRFNWHRAWTLTFNDEFAESKLDTKAWLTRYYWGDKMFKGSYSLSQDKHLVTDGKNLHLENGRLHITVKKEISEGISWNPKFGFVTREFGYTSGLINTAKSFRQKYGTFRAKIRISAEKDLHNAFWMVGNLQVPHIDVMKAAKKITVGNSYGNPADLKQIKQQRLNARGRAKFASDFFIYELEWKPGRLTWKINGIEIAATSSGVPEEEMYISFSAGLQSDVDGILPAHMEIDWVRCYQQNDLLSKA